MPSNATFENLGCKRFRIRGDWWDAHACAEVDFDRMEYSLRTQGGADEDEIDDWATRTWRIRRHESTWELFHDEAEWKVLVDSLRTRIVGTQMTLGAAAAGAPADVRDFFNEKVASLRLELQQLLDRGPGWYPFESYVTAALEEIYARA